MENPKFKARDLTRIALMAVVISVCAWISVPAPVPFTMQTFAIFCTLGLLGGKRGSTAVLLYLLMGAVGLPVFSGMTGGIVWLLGPTGGYLLGFLLSALLYWLLEGFARKGLFPMAAVLFLGLLLCYAFGTGWFVWVYTAQGKAMSLWKALSLCVFPFLIPDLVKLSLAMGLIRVLSPYLNRKK